MPQFLNEFLLCLYALDDQVWAGITGKLIAACNTLDASCSVNIHSEIVAYTVDMINGQNNKCYKLYTGTGSLSTKEYHTCRSIEGTNYPST